MESPATVPLFLNIQIRAWTLSFLSPSQCCSPRVHHLYHHKKKKLLLNHFSVSTAAPHSMTVHLSLSSCQTVAVSRTLLDYKLSQFIKDAVSILGPKLFVFISFRLTVVLFKKTCMGRAEWVYLFKCEHFQQESYEIPVLQQQFQWLNVQVRHKIQVLLVFNPGEFSLEFPSSLSLEAAF